MARCFGRSVRGVRIVGIDVRGERVVAFIAA